MGRKTAYAIAAPLIAALAGSATAQQVSPYAGPTGAIPKTTQSDPPWSGLSGASGDPTMTAEAIRQGAAKFQSCLAQLWPLAARRGITHANYVKYTGTLTPDLRIMDLLDNQPEFNRPIWDYLDLLVNEARIEKGRALLDRYRPVFAAIERAYGVDRYVVAAIWGVETDYGSLIGDRPVLRSTATLACIGRRQNYFRGEFLATLDILQRGDVRPDRLIGSWAGAFGPTQFMPTAFKKYAVDFDRDGHRDVVSSVSGRKVSSPTWSVTATWSTCSRTAGLKWSPAVGAAADPGSAAYTVW